MPQTPEPLPEDLPPALARARASLLTRAGRAFALLMITLVATLVVGLAVLDSALGHRLVTDRIAALRLESGLVIHIGRIDGSLFGTSQLHNVVLSDPGGRFMTVPEVDLTWYPLPALRLVMGWSGGLDIRELALHRGVLLRAPKLRPGNPDSPILPDFDIRLDRLAIDGLTVAPGLAGARRRIDFVAHADVHGGRVLLDCDGRLGGRDRLTFRLDSEPDRDRFALDLDYRAPRDGLLAGLSGVRHSVEARIGGAGRFSAWHGWMVARADGRRLAGALLDNRGGHYRLAGLLHPPAAYGGAMAQLGGERLGVIWDGTVAGGRFAGQGRLVNAALRVETNGAVDLTQNRAEGLGVVLRLLRPELLPRDWTDVARPGPGTLTARLDGPFSDLAIDHVITLARLDTDAAKLTGLRSAGVAHWHAGKLTVPLAVRAQTIDTGNPWFDARLAGTTLGGSLTWDGDRLSGDGWRLHARGLDAALVFKGDMAHGGYALAGRIDSHSFAVPRLGQLDATAKMMLVFGHRLPWTVAVNYAGTVSHFANGGMATALGTRPHVAGSLHWGGNRPLTMPDMRIVSDRIEARANVRYGPAGALDVVTSGRHADYGAFEGHVAMGHDGGIDGDARLASPLPAAGVRNVHLVFTDAPGGYRAVVDGDSRLGPFAGTAQIAVPDAAHPQDPVRITLADTHVFNTSLSGTLALDPAGLDGDIVVTGGGIGGTIHFAGKPGGAGEGGQAVVAQIDAHGARFGGDKPIAIGQASLSVDALFSSDNSTIDASLKAQGIQSGSVFIGRLLADATIINGAGSVTASLAGRRGTRFALQGTAAFTGDKIIAYVAGDYAGNAISMPRRAVVERDGTGWKLAPSQINFGSGAVIADGRFGGGPTELHLAISRMPLSLVDILYADLGLGGFVSGIIDYRNDHTGAPSGHASVVVKGLTRSGLVLTSRPLDLAFSAQLDAAALQARAVLTEDHARLGRLQALITDLPRGGTMFERVRAGTLRAQMRYAGPADSLWRLAAIDVFDLTGPIGVAAEVTGNLDNPVLSGAVASRDLRVQSSLSGSDIKGIDLAGSFNAGRLSLSHFSGTTPNGGRVVGSGTVDLTDVASKGMSLDMRLGATNAELVNRPEMGATITGPMRIVSNGSGGTIAGRLRIDSARWALGRTSGVQALPTIKVTERNTPADIAPPPARFPPWKLMIDAHGANRIDVHGMGLESEWSTDVRVRGDTANPQIFGGAEVVRGSYEFAGKRFDLTRGRIRFNGEVPIDPLLDIVAQGEANSVTATISISGSAQQPVIAFSSTPSLPEEELLSRILFGSSITQISAPEAVQLAAALASLRSGGGLDPINKLRGAIGLDRLRVVSADASTGRGTSLAVGKYLGRRFYVELVTDGKGYSATSIEFRLTRWLSLLGTISTVDDESINLKVSKDY